MKPKLPLFAAAAVAALSLGACQDERPAQAALPEPAPLGQLAYDAGLPVAPPVPVRWTEPEVGYGWADRAHGLQETFYDEPPAYGFDYGDADPWVWRTADDREMYAEPWDDGYRYYYYEPGADYPYYVQDDRYGYAFDDGLLVSVITIAGAYLAADRFDDFAPVAGRYYSRGHELRRASYRAPRIQVVETVWAERAPKFRRTAEPWLKAPKADKAWRKWRESDEPRRRFATATGFRGADRRPREAAIDIRNVPPGRADKVRADHRVPERVKEPRTDQAKEDKRGPDRDLRAARGPKAAQAAPGRQAEKRDDRGPKMRQARKEERVQARAAEDEAQPAANVEKDGGHGQGHQGPKARKPDGGGPGKPNEAGGGKGKGGGKKD